MVGAVALDAAPAHRFVVVTDDVVGPLYLARVVAALGEAGAGDRVLPVAIPSGEAHKTRETWGAVTDQMLAAGCGRDTTVVALGGGVVGDLAGFVAATFMRGVPYIQVPTTLLAMVDASVGGKTGVDTPAGKNLVGAFHQPSAVVVDPEVLRSLPSRQLRAGLAEVVKHGVVADAAYLDRVEEALPTITTASMRRGTTPAELVTLIGRAVEIKAGVVCRDEREGGMRKILNFGHTIGHALEVATDYALLHGEAVAIGMAVEARLAEYLDVAAPGTASRIRTVLERAELPTAIPESLAPEAIVAATHLDKKARGGRVEYALPSRVGAMAAADAGWAVAVDDRDVRRVLSRPQ